MGLPCSPRTMQQLVEQFYTPLYRYAFRLSGNQADAEDLTQETFCKAQVHYRQLRDPDKVRAWLFQILRNAYLRQCRESKQEPSGVVADWNGVPAREEPSPLIDVEPERLQLALGLLPEVFRTPIILYYFEDFSYRDIADQMDLPIGTVMSRLARAKAFLRQHLSPAVENAKAPNRRADHGL